MNKSAETENMQHTQSGKRSAALSSVMAAVFLTALKLVVGVMTGSLGILAEAAHSGLDLVAALVTFFAVRISDRPADERYRYGYGKVENLSALIETLLLLITCVWIIYEGIQRLFLESVEIDATPWAFGVMVISVVTDVSRSRVLYRAARKYNSQALEADALHFSTDIWSSLVVIGGLLLVWLSGRLGPGWEWLLKGDAIAALVVAVIVIFVSLQLGRRAVSVLLDVAPPGLVDQITAEVGKVPGVRSVGPVRVRQAGASQFVDLVVNVGRSASLEEAHQIAESVDKCVGGLVGRGDVIVHVDPVQHSDESLPETVSALASRYGLQVHDVHAHELHDSFFVDLHVEVPAGLTLAEAHAQVSGLEMAVRQELPRVRDIYSHIEPLASSVAPSEHLSPDEEERLRAEIMAVAAGVSGLSDCHRLHIRAGRDGYDVVLHCLADPDLPMAEAHRLADDLGLRLQIQIAAIKHVLVHVEPKDEWRIQSRIG